MVLHRGPVLTPYATELDPGLCVGFGFDGASVMAGNRGGVHVMLKKTVPHAVYVHCYSHGPNLVLCTAAKVSPGIETFFNVMNNSFSFYDAQTCQISGNSKANVTRAKSIRAGEIP